MDWKSPGGVKYRAAYAAKKACTAPGTTYQHQRQIEADASDFHPEETNQDNYLFQKSGELGKSILQNSSRLLSFEYGFVEYGFALHGFSILSHPICWESRTEEEEEERGH